MQQWLYRGGRPNWLARRLDAMTAAMVVRGRAPDSLVTLEVAGRTSGAIMRVPLVVVPRDGERYLVSMLGPDSDWVRNVRVADGHAALRHAGRKAVTLVEVPPSERAPVLSAYVRIAKNGRAHIPLDADAPLSEFERIATAFPVFRIVPDAS
ncbi:MAG: nitroreductase/quinone reductase family protein [Thermomicrobiales bacterium]